MEVALREIAGQLGGELIGDGELRIARIATLEGATPDAIAFLANPKYRAQLASTRAGCVIVGPAVRDEAAARGIGGCAIAQQVVQGHSRNSG